MERPHRHFASGWQANGPAGAVGNLDMTFVVLSASGSAQAFELNCSPKGSRGKRMRAMGALVAQEEVALRGRHNLLSTLNRLRVSLGGHNGGKFRFVPGEPSQNIH